MAASTGVSKPLRSLGEFFRMAWETLTLIPRRPFAWREFLIQSWFVARVALLPTLMLAIPFTVLAVFTFNLLLVEFGAADYSGVGAGEGTVTQIGPIVTVLVVSGAGATAMCADLGARTIREELDALRVMGINPIQSLVVPRVLAATSFGFYAASYFMRAGLTSDASFIAFMAPQLVQGFAMGLFFVSMLAVIFDGLPPHKIPAASGLSNFLRITAGSFAISITTTLWDRREALHQARLADTITAYTPAYQQSLAHLHQFGMNDQSAAGAMGIKKWATNQ